MNLSLFGRLPPPASPPLGKFLAFFSWFQPVYRPSAASHRGPEARTSPSSARRSPPLKLLSAATRASRAEAAAFSACGAGNAPWKVWGEA